MFQVIKKSNIWFTFSGLFVLASILAVLIFGLKPGIDFTGGSLIEIEFTDTRPPMGEIRDLLGTIDLSGANVQSAGEKGVLLRMQFISEAQHQAIIAALRDRFAAKDDVVVESVGDLKQSGSVVFETKRIETAAGTPAETETDAQENPYANNKLIERRVETVGPSISAHLQSRAWQLGITVVIAIVLYIAYTFRRVSKPVQSWKFGLTAIIALVHDVMITIGVFALLGHFYGIEVNIPFIVALLTILGYSVNDTIVVFDRIRERLIKDGYGQFAETVNRAINQTLVRSFNTSSTTLLVLFALFFFGGETIKYFSLALIIGIGFGTYSSIFLASPLLVVWAKWRQA